MSSKDIYLRSDAAREIVQFVPAPDTVTIIRMFLSLTGCWSPSASSTTRATMSLEAGRREYRRLRKAGYGA